MDTAPFRELIKAAKKLRKRFHACLQQNGTSQEWLESATAPESNAIAAAERELAQYDLSRGPTDLEALKGDCPLTDERTAAQEEASRKAIGHSVPSGPPAMAVGDLEALRLADEIIGDQMKWCPCRAHTCRTCRKARAYRAILAPINRTRRGLGV